MLASRAGLFMLGVEFSLLCRFAKAMQFQKCKQLMKSMGVSPAPSFQSDVEIRW